MLSLCKLLDLLEQEQQLIRWVLVEETQESKEMERMDLLDKLAMPLKCHPQQQQWPPFALD
jgi:hypothetical protein